MQKKCNQKSRIINAQHCYNQDGLTTGQLTVWSFFGFMNRYRRVEYKQREPLASRV